MSTPLADTALAQIFTDARTHSQFTDQPVNDALLRRAYELAAQGPTSFNSQPGRFVFLKTAAARERLIPALTPGNAEKTRAAPVTVIVAADSRFYDNLPRTTPHAPNARDMFANNAGLAAGTASRNSALTGAYFILALRALGLDAGPMSGFDAAKVDAEFFPDGRFKSNFLINVGHGDPAKLNPRQLRLPFDEAVQVL